MDYLLTNSVAKTPKNFEKYFIDPEKIKQAFKHPLFGEPVSYRNCSFDNFECYNACLVEVAHILKRYEKGAVSLMSEQTGTGKTHLAIATAREWFRKKLYKWVDDNAGRDFGFKDYAEREFWEFYEHNKPIFLTESETYNLEYGNINYKFYLPNRRLVIIDDIFAGRTTEISRAVIYEIVNTRISMYNLDTIFTTNILPEKMIDNRISSRLQSGNVYIINNARDYRL